MRILPRAVRGLLEYSVRVFSCVLQAHYKQAKYKQAKYKRT